MKLWRIAPRAFDSRYGHPNGWRIQKHVRDWSLRGYGGGMFEHTLEGNPKVWWEITRLHVAASSAQAIHSENTLREARAWCDEHVWDVAEKRAVPA